MPYPYFYGDQADAFSYYRIPRALITGREFRQVSIDAKLLYGQAVLLAGLPLETPAEYAQLVCSLMV